MPHFIKNHVDTIINCINNDIIKDIYHNETNMVNSVNENIIYDDRKKSGSSSGSGTIGVP